MAKAQDRDETQDKATAAAPDDIASLRERIARLEGQLSAQTPEARPGDPPTGPKYVVLYPNWSDKPAGSIVRESQLGGAANAARLVSLGHVTPSRDPETPEGDAPAA